jgi:D-alanine-D-alanine ligase
MDKIMSKRIWRQGGLDTPDWREPRNLDELEQAFQALGTPMIVKPAHEGSTLGLTKVVEAGQLPSAWLLSSGLDTAVLAEQFIAGRELTVAVVQLGEQPYALPIIEIVAPGGQYDYDSKYFSDETRYLCPADLPAPLTQRIQSMVLEAFKQLGCEGWARADVMLRTSDQAPFLLEINTSPGMTGHSLVPMAARAAGLDYGDLCRLLLSQASLKVGRCAGAGA